MFACGKVKGTRNGWAGVRTDHQDALQKVPKERGTRRAGERFLNPRQVFGRSAQRGKGPAASAASGRGCGAHRPFSLGGAKLESNLEVRVPSFRAQNWPQSGNTSSVRKVFLPRQSWGERPISGMYSQNLSRFGNWSCLRARARLVFRCWFEL